MLAESEETRYWLVQYNPDHIDLISYLWDHGDKVPHWWIKEKNSRIAVGDVVFVWKAKGSEDGRCVLGKGKVIPGDGGSSDYRRRIHAYARNGADGWLKTWLERPYFEMRYEKLVLEDPVYEDQLLSSGMSRLGSFGFRTRLLSEKDGRLIEALVDRHKGEIFQAETTPAAIDIKGLQVSFKGKEVIKGIDLSIPPGKITAIIGPSGCGKTTLLRCLNRLAELTAGSEVQGEVHLDGQDIRRMDPMILRRQVGMVFQKPNPFPMSVRANILYGVKANHLNPSYQPWDGAEADTVSPGYREPGIGENDPLLDWNSECSQIEALEEPEGDRVPLPGDRVLKAVRGWRPWAAVGQARGALLESSAVRAVSRRLPWLLPRGRSDSHIRSYPARAKVRDELGHRLRKEAVRGWRPWGAIVKAPGALLKSSAMMAVSSRLPWLMSRGRSDSLIKSCLARAALWDELEHRLRENAVTLSVGQQQRLCIARTLAISPRVILMDEPAASLDPISTYRLESSILAMRGKHTVVIVTHNMQEARRISDYTAFLYMGELVEFGETHALFESPRFEQTRQYIAGRFG